MTIYIVEDDLFHLEDLKISIEELGYVCVGHSDDPFEALAAIGELLPKAVILDIHLNGKEAGIVLGEKIKRLYRIPVFFTTAHKDKDLMIKAAHIDPVAYLTKPISTSDLQAALILAAQKQPLASPQQSEPLFIKSGTKLIKVAIERILLAHTDTKNYCSLLTTDGKKLTVRYSILQLKKILGDKRFIQTNRSYIVNWDQVDAFHEGDRTLDVKGHTVPVGRAFKDAVQQRLRVL